MFTLLIAVGALVGYVIAYHTYGRWLARRVFRLDPQADVPSRELCDDVDYVPTKRGVVFGHHFTSIAGTGPIVGPALAVMWGWLPALLWVLLGSVLIGAVHDFGALVVSLRNHGQTVGDIAARVLNPRVRFLFLFILFMALTIVLAIFGLVIAAVFRMYPASILPCLVQIPIAIAIGVWLHGRGINLLVPSLIALALMYVTVIFGDWGPLHAINQGLASLPTIVWVAVLLVYSYFASVLPVWTLLQPRDYINSLQLLTAIGLVLIGLAVAAFAGGAPPTEGAMRPPLEIVAPAVRSDALGAPPIWPFLFITVACGACSGFHCLVASGTSSKQLRAEPDAQLVGYGAMLTEGFLATLVILACVAGLGLGIADGNSGAVLVGEDAYAARYGSWHAAGGLPAKIGAFVDGSANFLKALRVPAAAAVALMGVFVASFAGTTLDTACRLQRYVIQELATACLVWKGVGSGQSAVGREDFRGSYFALRAPIDWLRNKHGATILGVVIAGIIAALPKPGAELSWTTAGTGGLILWPLFGATNQLLAGLAFLVVAFYLWRRRVPVWFIVAPMLFMLVMPAWAMIQQLPAWIWPPDGNPNWAVVVIATLTLVLEAWMLVEAAALWPKVRGAVEKELPPLRERTAGGDEGMAHGRSC